MGQRFHSYGLFRRESALDADQLWRGSGPGDEPARDARGNLAPFRTGHDGRPERGQGASVAVERAARFDGVQRLDGGRSGSYFKCSLAKRRRADAERRTVRRKGNVAEGCHRGN
uniref:(northern house mosquito) hypothetical protein n=1 Tax=Culex pipiens TaxID=7175 RepID=A0A8D8MW46_CULPI